MHKISVVIVTRNRCFDLNHCIASLLAQTKKLDELIVVDNNSTDQTKDIVNNIKLTAKIPIRYVLCKKIGYPEVYNHGLESARYNWVAFIDDDCIAQKDWFKRISFIINQTKNIEKVAAILGSSDEYNTNHISALVKSYIDQTGLIGVTKSTYILKDLEVLDSKNITYNRYFLDRKKIRFDVSLLKYAQGASEDCDLGMQIQYHGGRAIYDEKIKVRHKDPKSIRVYYSKIAFTLRNHLVYEKKWEYVRRKMSIHRPLNRKILLAFSYLKKYKLNSIKSVLFFFHIFVSFVYVKTLRMYYKKKKFLNSVVVVK